MFSFILSSIHSYIWDLPSSCLYISHLWFLQHHLQFWRRDWATARRRRCWRIAPPNTTVAATLRLLKNSVRINTSGATYQRNNEEGIPIDDERFVENNVPFKAVATSHGFNDAGLFELNFKDDRYLPFEGAGVISRWKLEMPTPVPLRPFDYNTISDVVLHVKYTSREDVGLFKTKAVTHVLAYLLNP